ncbi:virginiamycin A acetyltransferase [Oribacterium sp. KHPX15]|nr:virginiamycin A acetyltransferase [Oribacterium sp. KHPX15]
MKNGKTPNPNTIYPIAGCDKEIYVKPTIKNPNIIVGEFTYMADSDFGFYGDWHQWYGITRICQIMLDKRNIKKSKFLL